MKKVSWERSKTLYEKKGNRYYPLREEIEYDSLPEGAHLVIVSPGRRTIKYYYD